LATEYINEEFVMSGCIVGWAHTKFGKHEGVELETLIVDAATEALIDAKCRPADVDEIYIGHFNGGFVMQDFPASLVLQATWTCASSPPPGSKTPARPERPPFIRG
jgi:acetyl-CoA acetyltransferase